MRLDKFSINSLICHFGMTEERLLVKSGFTHDAYQIAHARMVMHHALLKSVKEFKFALKAMTESSRDENGLLEYHLYYFVHDELTRELVKEFAKRFDK